MRLMVWGQRAVGSAQLDELRMRRGWSIPSWQSCLEHPCQGHPAKAKLNYIYCSSPLSGQRGILSASKAREQVCIKRRVSKATIIIFLCHSKNRVMNPEIRSI